MKALHYQAQKEQNNLEERLTQEEVCQYFTNLGPGSLVRFRGKMVWRQNRHPARKSHFSSARWLPKIYPGRTRTSEPARSLVLHCYSFTLYSLITLKLLLTAL